MSREQYLNNVRELGIPLYKFAGGYIKPLYLEPIFSAKEQYCKGYPYTMLPKEQQPNYEKGICPVIERLYEKEMIVTAYNYPPLTKFDMDDIVNAFTKGRVYKK